MSQNRPCCSARPSRAAGGLDSGPMNAKPWKTILTVPAASSLRTRLGNDVPAPSLAGRALEVLVQVDRHEAASADRGRPASADTAGRRPPRRATVGSIAVTRRHRRRRCRSRPDQVERELRPIARVSRGSFGRSARLTEHLERPVGLRGELSGSAWVAPSRWSRDSPRERVPRPLASEVRPVSTMPAGAFAGTGRSPARGVGRPTASWTAWPNGGSSGTIAEFERAFGPVGMCGFRQGPAIGEREPRMLLGLVNQAAKRSTWQPPVDSRPRCLSSKVSVEATSVPAGCGSVIQRGCDPGSVA